MEDQEEVFEDAVEELEHVAKIDTNALNNNKSKSSIKTFKFKVGKKSKVPPDVSLEFGLEQAQIAIDHFFNNRYEEAKKLAEPLAHRSIYHALGYGTFMYLKAVMTFEQEHVARASLVLDETLTTIDTFRKKSKGLVDSLGRFVKKQDYDSYTEMEIHAELVYAECLLFKAMLTVCEDETLVSFIKAGLKVRQCYQSFRECWNILQHRDWTNDKYKIHFEGGVRLGVGTFNLMISLLPARVMRLLEFIGFTGSREAGMKELMFCYQQKDCLRQFMASIILLGYHLFVTNLMGQDECDLQLVSEILEEKLKTYPQGAFFLFFRGRYELIQGNCEVATKWYIKANQSQNEWPQFHHVGCWELVFASLYQCKWREAVVHVDRLLVESRWSRCLYAYFKAVFYCMLDTELTDQERKEQLELMESVPKLKQKIAGKSLPMEKFAIRKAERFGKQNGRLVLPALELIYLWNGFKIIGRQYSAVEKFYVLIEAEMVEAEERRKRKTAGQNPFSLEDDCLLLLLRGICLKSMSSPLQAEECFRKIIASGPKLTVDKYLAPYATVELALVLREQGDLQQAAMLLETAKNSYKDYSLQSRLHFRIHAAQAEMNSGKEESEDGKEDVILPIKQNSPNLVQDLENITETELREMMPHI